MKFLAGLGLLATVAFVKADDSDDVHFLTQLVNDYKLHTGEYASFIRTAKSIPNQFSSLAVQVATYTDDSYTTLLDKDNMDIDDLEDFASEFPWYTRLDVGGDGSDDEGSASGAGSGSTTSGSSSETSDGSDSDSEDSSSSTDGVRALVAPLGAVLGAVGIALL